MVLNDQREVNLIREAQKGFSDKRSYWIGGSTDNCTSPWSIIDIGSYLTENPADGNNNIPLVYIHTLT